MIALVTKNPELFQKIALEVKAKVEGANGQPKESATPLPPPKPDDKDKDKHGASPAH